MSLPYEVNLVMNAHMHSGAKRTERSVATVIEATPKTRYGIANGHPNRRLKFLHRPVAAAVAWRRGKIVTIGARWACGRWTNEAVFVDDPTTPGTALCPLCAEAVGAVA